MGLAGICVLQSYYDFDFRADLCILPNMTLDQIRKPLSQSIWRSGCMAMCRTMAMRTTVHAKDGRFRSGLL